MRDDGADGIRLALGTVAAALKSPLGSDEPVAHDMARQFYNETRNSLCNTVGFLMGQLVGMLPMIPDFDVETWLMSTRGSLETWIAEGCP